MRRFLITVSLLMLSNLAARASSGMAGVEKLAGKWSVKAETPNGPLELELELKLSGSDLIGTLGTFQGSVPLSNLKFQDPDLSVEVSLGGNSFKLTGVFKDGKLTGTWQQVGGEAQGTWGAERKAESAPPLPAGGISGSWDALAVTPNGDLKLVMDLKQEGEKVTGTLSSELGTVPLKEASFKDNKLQYDIEIGGNTYRTEGTLKDDKLSGKWSSVGGTDTGSFSATRKPAATAPAPAAASTATLEGIWNSVAVTPDGNNLPFQMNLEQSGNVLSGHVVGPDGNITMQKLTFANNVLTFEIEYGGATYRVEATLANGKFTGKWSAVGGTESGPWSAERKNP